jgi:hypothetical protein
MKYVKIHLRKVPPRKLTRHFLDEVANILPYNTGTIGLRNDKGSTKIQITIDAISAITVEARESPNRSVSPAMLSRDGRISDARSFQVTKTASLPHHST